MAKIRLLIFITSILIVGSIGTFASYYARGYKFDIKTLKFQPNGILVIKSEPDGASVFIDGSLKTATNATVSLPPGIYDVEVKKDGFFSWYKRLTINKEVVTQASISLFRNVPSLSPVTLSGAINPIMSENGGKIAYMVLPAVGVTDDKVGLWVLDTFSLPLGFSNDPKRVTDGDLINATYAFSPDARQIMLTTSNGIFVLDTGSFTPQNQRVNIVSQKTTILAGWKKDKLAKDTSLIKNLPPELTDILTRKTNNFTFSPDQNMILYTASASGTLPDNLISPLPGASTQKQERNVESSRTYIYDIKEDRNFLISDQPEQVLRWMPTGRHLLLAIPGQIVIMDYDGTNREVVYSGSYVGTYAFPFNNTTRLLILTNLGAGSASPNLYTLTIK
jgi:WD40 repeat protein